MDKDQTLSTRKTSTSQPPGSHARSSSPHPKDLGDYALSRLLERSRTPYANSHFENPRFPSHFLKTGDTTEIDDVASTAPYEGSTVGELGTLDRAILSSNALTLLEVSLADSAAVISKDVIAKSAAVVDCLLEQWSIQKPLTSRSPEGQASQNTIDHESSSSTVESSSTRPSGASKLAPGYSNLSRFVIEAAMELNKNIGWAFMPEDYIAMIDVHTSHVMDRVNLNDRECCWSINDGILYHVLHWTPLHCVSRDDFSIPTRTGRDLSTRSLVLKRHCRKVYRQEIPSQPTQRYPSSNAFTALRFTNRNQVITVYKIFINQRFIIINKILTFVSFYKKRSSLIRRLK